MRLEMIPRFVRYEMLNMDSHGSLMSRLTHFWNSSTEYWTILESPASLTSGNRQKAVQFLSGCARVLDLGCGNGANAALLPGRLEQRYVGVDIAFQGLQGHIKKEKGHVVRLVCADAGHLPLRSARFDGVLLTFVLEHSVEPTALMAEVARVTKPAARVVILGPAWDFPFWYPPSMRQCLTGFRPRASYAMRRFFSQMRCWAQRREMFLSVGEPDCLVRGVSETFEVDTDAVYVVWTWEVLSWFKKRNFRLTHWEVEDRLLGKRIIGRALKQLLMRLPLYRFAGGTVLLVLDR